MKVLVVEDDAANRYLLEVLLREHRHEAVLAENGVAAMNVLQREPVDFIISDILMPQMDGYRLCRECKQDERLRDIPFLFITSAYTDEKDERFAADIGADGFIRRPADPEAIMEKIEQVSAASRAKGRPLIEKQDEISYLRAYSERVVNNLEKKVSDLEKEMAARKRVEEDLQQREERLRLITETIEDVFWISTPGVGRMEYISPNYERLWERSRESLYADPKSFLDSVHPDDRPGVEHILELHAQGLAYSTQYRIVQRNGTVLWMQERGFPVRDDAGQLRAMTGVVSDITERKRLEQELERQARTDSLTGVANRRHFFAQSREAIGLSRRYGRPLSLLMFDIDHFKPINDTYGHHAGDVVLKALAQAAVQTLRDVDLLGRVGGEEFAVLLPETDAPHALRAAERVREAISATEALLEDGTALRFTVSIGVATLSEADTNLDAFLNRADMALYQAKNAGRNTVCAA